jgi:hypothetical protein
MSAKIRISTLVIALAIVTALPFSKAVAQAYDADEVSEHQHEEGEDDGAYSSIIEAYGCTRASRDNMVTIDEGNKKLNKFLSACATATKNSPWCAQLVRPNPSSKSTFSCTYGSDQPHTLINPDEKTWKNAFLAATLVSELSAQGIGVAQIYNWWRPEPYNKNVGGAAGRHPFGTSVDVRFKTMKDMEKAHKQLCSWRAKGRLRAVGYYGSTGLHFGIGDKLANTWGKSCSSKLVANQSL